jgi:REP element-mobilizing transposase RayT
MVKPKGRFIRFKKPTQTRRGNLAMASHQQLLYHLVFSTKERTPLLRNDEIRQSVWDYMAGVAHNLQGRALCIGGYYDNAHALVRIPAKQAVADFVRQLKCNTSKHINEEKLIQFKFHWQDGYGAFTVSPSQKESVIHYIDRQLDHHQIRTFKEEYLAILEACDIEYDPRYIWE